MARVLALGGAHIDHTGRLEQAHRPGASNPGDWESRPGGGVFNAARNLARLGHEVTLVAPRGGDAAGERVGDAAEAAGVIDCPITFLDRATASYTAILEPDGNLVTALADMEIYDRLPPRRLLTARFRRMVEAADLILCDANLPADTLATLGIIARKRRLPLAAIAVSPAKVVRFADALSDLELLFMNAAEAATLTDGAADAAGALAGRRLRGGVITAGPAPVRAFRGDERIEISPPALPELADVTGAGDALAAGFLDALIRGADLATCLGRGIALAQLTAAVPGPVRADLTPALLDRAQSLIFDTKLS